METQTPPWPDGQHVYRVHVADRFESTGTRPGFSTWSERGTIASDAGGTKYVKCDLTGILTPLASTYGPPWCVSKAEAELIAAARLGDRVAIVRGQIEAMTAGREGCHVS